MKRLETKKETSDNFNSIMKEYKNIHDSFQTPDYFARNVCLREEAHPEVTILDPPDAIQHLRDCQYMLQDVADLNLCNPYGQVGVPKQLVITKDAALIADAVTKAGLMLLLVAKPLVNDGSTKSYQHSLAYDQHSLRKLEPPLVLQEFVNHGGVLFKVYIVGEAIKVVRRFSHPNVGQPELSSKSGLFRVPRVSCATASAEGADLNPGISGYSTIIVNTTIVSFIEGRLLLFNFVVQKTQVNVAVVYLD